MSKQMKLILGIALGFAAFTAYKKLKRTETVYVDTLDTLIPTVTAIETVV